MKRPPFRKDIGPDDCPDWHSCPLCGLYCKRKREVRAHWRSKHAMLKSRMLRAADATGARLAGELGRQFYNRRLELGIGETKAALRVGLPPRLIGPWENGTSAPSLREMSLLAASLGLHLELVVRTTKKAKKGR